MRYLLGIDNGNTLSKAALFDFAGNEIATASCDAETFYPHPGWTERSMESLWQSTATAIRGVLSESGIKASEIAGVGTTGHGNGLYLLDKAGLPVRNGIQSLDTRAAQILIVRREAKIQEKAFSRILQAFWPAQPNALLPWLKQYEPESYRRIDKILLVKDYIKFCLTGEITSDYTDMSGTCLLNNWEQRYDSSLLDLYGIPEMEAALPRLVQSFDIVGQITASAAEQTGLKAGTPVVSGLFDVDAAAIGAGVIDTGVLCIVAGTWSINEVILASPIVDPRVAMISIAPIPNHWLALEASATSTTNLEWFIRECCGTELHEAQRRGVSVYDICNELVASLPTGSEVVFHPFLFGSNVRPEARAGFFNVAGWHTKAHLIRALYEGVVFSHLSHVEKLRHLGHFPTARLTGGGARSDVWAQIFADALNVVIEVPTGQEVSAWGAAMCAGIGVKVYADAPDAVAQSVRIGRVYEPVSSKTAVYLERYQEYQHLITNLWDG